MRRLDDAARLAAIRAISDRTVRVAVSLRVPAGPEPYILAYCDVDGADGTVRVIGADGYRPLTGVEEGRARTAATAVRAAEIRAVAGGTSPAQAIVEDAVPPGVAGEGPASRLRRDLEGTV